MKDILLFLQQNNINFIQNANLSKLTWIKRGGTAKLYIIPDNVFELENITTYLYKHNHDFLIVGHTSNIYIKNTTNIPICITTKKCNSYSINGDNLRCDAGVSVINLARFAIKNGIKGFEYLTGLPGTVAGAIVNNSSCKDNSISELIQSVKIVEKNGRIQELKYNDLKYDFRSSILKRKELIASIISVQLKIDKAPPEILQEIANKNNSERLSLLEGESRNLGCTMNHPFINGKMPIVYSLLMRSTSLILKICKIKLETRRKITKKLLFFFSGFSDIEKYVSDKNPIIFLWRDDLADNAFPKYLAFMDKVYKTNKLEIEIL